MSGITGFQLWWWVILPYLALATFVIGCSYVKRNQGISPVGPGQRGRSPRVGEALLSRLTGGAEDGPDR